MNSATLAALIMVVGIVITLCLGFPIGLSIGISSAAAIMVILPFDKAMITASQRMFTGANSFSLLAIPFFVLAGNIMNNGGIAKRLIGCAKLIAHRLPGSLAQTNIVANMLFGAISGSGVAAASAMGSILGPMEEKEGYSKEFSAAVNIASGPTGMMIPPSNIMIVYSTVAGSVSIAALFMAGYIPGILWGVACMILTGFMAKKRGYIDTERYHAKEVLKTLWEGIPSLLLIVIVIGGILGGVFTATEGSAIAVVYSLLLSFIYRNLKIRDLPKILLDSVKTTAIVEFLVCVSSIMSWVMSFTKIQQQSGRHSAHHELHPSDCRYLHGSDPGSPDLHPNLPANRTELGHECGSFRTDDGYEPLCRHDHSSGRCNPVCRLQDRQCQD